MSDSIWPKAIRALLLSIVVGVACSTPSFGADEDLLNDSLNFSGTALYIRPYIKMPFGSDNIISMTTRPGDTRLFVSVQQGTIFAINDDGNGNTSAEVMFDTTAGITVATGRFQYGFDGHEGLQSVAFHPDFDNPASSGYGKFYTTLLESRPATTEGHHYLGDSSSGDSEADSVLLEWTYDHELGDVDPSTYREVFRARLPVRDHMIKQARFNPYAKPGDEDYGLLYVTHGDSSGQSSNEDRPQLLDNIYGKMLRINPLESGDNPYSIPTTNPFYNDSDPDVLEEIYAYGFRNPHNFSFNQDDGGNTHILVGDIGRNNIEEVNLVAKGGNYGWTKREGTFVHLQGNDFNPPGADAGYLYGIDDLPANEATVGVDAQGNNYVYPVAQYDHNDFNVEPGDDYVSVAIASGFVIRNGSDPALHNQFIFNNFGGNFINFQSDVYHTDFEDMLAAVTQLDPEDTARDEPDELTQAEVQRLFLALDYDSDPETEPFYYYDMNSMMGVFRNDARYGEGVLGEMYISTKWDSVRTIYLVTNSVPLAGDYNKDHKVSAADYTIWRDSLGETGYHLPADGNGDGVVDEEDYDIWIDHFGEVWSITGSGSGTGSSSVSVPEPASLGLIGIACLALVTARIRRFRGG